MYQKQRLANGLNLITSPMNGTGAVTVLVLLPVGSRYETPEINGVSHFVEHLMFKGTTKRPTSLDITKELDAVGAEFNAFTSKDYTGYYVKTSADKVELAFDILSDMIFNSTFDEKEINKERGVIIEEIKMYDDNPIMSLHDLFEQTVFGNQPLGRTIAGPEQVIKKITRQQLLDYKNKFYYPGNMVVSVAGKVSQATAKKLAEKYFGGNSSKNKKSEFVKFKADQKSLSVNVRYKDTKQIQLGLGFYPLGDKRMYALQLLAVILGGNMSSRLFCEIREALGLCYYIRTDVSPYQDTGAFMVQSGLDKSNLPQAINVILKELKKVADHGVTKQELKTAKDYLKGKVILSLEDSETIADWYAKQQALMGKTETVEDRLKKFFAVTESEVKKVALDIFKPNALNIAAIGPFKNKQEISKLVKWK
jgi:predicted Zn-dependent peptidase